MKLCIFAMSLDRSSAKQRAESYRKPITDHLIECILYGDSFKCYNHWISELAAWIDDVNSTKLKIRRNPPKFKESEYREYLFGLFGNTTSDTRGALLSYKANNKEYPDFEIDKYLVLRTYGASQDLAESVCRLLATSKGREDTSVEDISNLIHSVLDVHCLPK